MHWPWGRIQRVGALALVLLSAGALLLRARSDEVPFVPGSGAPWVMAPVPVSSGLEQWGREAPPSTVFWRHFELAAVPDRAVLELRALRRFGVWVNGQVPEGGHSDGAGWRRMRSVDLTPHLRAGANEIRVQVENLRGPGLLSASAPEIGLSGGPLSSGPEWYVALDGRELGAAIPADDTRTNPAALGVETPARALGESADALLALLVLGAALAVLARRVGPALAVRLPVAVLAAAALAWTWLWFSKVSRIPAAIGFDARHHRAYVDFLLEHGSLPLATDGWSMYHPPLFYAVAAAASLLGDAAMRAVPWLCGIGNVFVAEALASRLFDGDVRTRVFAALFAATLPMNLTTAAYFSNEVPHAFLVGMALIATVDALRAPQTRASHALLVGLWFGLAALTKFTALAVAPVAFFFLLCKRLAVERSRPGAAIAFTATAVGAMALVAGWFYVRAWVQLGTPVVGNWNLPEAGQVWWQQPGFHTLAWYTGFGEALRHPYLAGFHSFWDGLWSTLWGDGGIAGRMFPADRHEFWRYDFMSAGYLLALPVAGLMAAGALRCVHEALTDADGGRRAALSFVATAVFAIAVSMLGITLALPFFAQAKAFYGLCMLAPLSVFFAAGAARIDVVFSAPGRLPLRAAFAGTLAACLGAFFLGVAA